MMKRMAAWILLVLTLCGTSLPALAANKHVSNEDAWLKISMKNEIIVDPCTMQVAYNVKNFNKQVPSWDYLENVVLHFPGGDVHVDHVPGKKTAIGNTQVNITKEMIQAGQFTVSYSLDYYDYATNSKVRTITGRVTLPFRTAPDSLAKVVEDVKTDLADAFWYGLLLILVLIGVLCAFTGGGILVIFHK